MRPLVLVYVVLLAVPALADVTMTSVTKVQGKQREVTLSVRGEQALFEMVEASGQKRTMVRDGAAKKLFIINHEQKQVVVVSEADSKKLEERQAAFRAQMQAQLSKLPPEQRAKIEASMNATLDAKPHVYTYEKKKGPARKVAGFGCADHVVKRDGVVQGEGCFAAWKDVGVTAAEFKSTLSRAMPEQATLPMQASLDAQDNAPGFPVYRTHVDDKGALVSETTLTSLAKSALPAERFAVPKGYAEKSMPNPLAGPPLPPAPAAAPSPPAKPSGK